jgi:hypothetical protein
VYVTQGASNLTFAHNHTSYTECGYFFYGWSGYSVSHMYVLNNTMDHLDFNGSENVCSGQGVTFIGNVDHFTINGNTLGPYIANHYTQTGGIDTLQEDGNTFLGPSCRYGVHSTDCWGNHDATVDIHQNILQIFGDAQHIDFSNNVMRNTGTNGNSILLETTPPGQATISDVTIHNNLFDHDADGTSVDICPVQGLTFTNNTVVGTLGWGTMFRNLDNSTCGMSANGSNYNVTHNIFVLTSGSPALSEGGCGTNCTFDYNVTNDATATGARSVDNWTPSWQNTNSYQPATGSLPYPTGYGTG